MKGFGSWKAVIFLWVVPAAGDDFETYLRAVTRDAVAEGVAVTLVEAAFAGLTLDERVVRFDRRQPETTQTLDEYLALRVTDAVVAEGKAKLTEHAAAVASAEQTYGVSGSTLVAIWGIESRFGRHTGSFDVIRSLATLAYDGRREAFFRRELIAALRVMQAERIAPRALQGSWAGAMGQPQFMPSTFLRFASDGNDDGRRDIWGVPADVLASIGKLLAEAGWRDELGWGAPVAADFEVRDSANDEGCRALRSHSEPMPVDAVRALGVDFEAPAGTTLTLWRAENHTFVASPNFRALLSYNCANSYALAVAMLADRIAGDRSVEPPSAS